MDHLHLYSLPFTNCANFHFIRNAPLFGPIMTVPVRWRMFNFPMDIIWCPVLPYAPSLLDLSVLIGCYGLFMGNGFMARLVGAAPTPSTSVHSLGVLLDPGLLLWGQVMAVARAAPFQLGRLANCDSSWKRELLLQ